MFGAQGDEHVTPISKSKKRSSSQTVRPRHSPPEQGKAISVIPCAPSDQETPETQEEEVLDVQAEGPNHKSKSKAKQKAKEETRAPKLVVHPQSPPSAPASRELDEEERRAFKKRNLNRSGPSCHEEGFKWAVRWLQTTFSLLGAVAIARLANVDWQVHTLFSGMACFEAAIMMIIAASVRVLHSYGSSRAPRVKWGICVDKDKRCQKLLKMLFPERCVRTSAL